MFYYQEKGGWALLAKISQRCQKSKYFLLIRVLLLLLFFFLVHYLFKGFNVGSRHHKYFLRYKQKYTSFIITICKEILICNDKN